jgi:hypothetical protein
MGYFSNADEGISYYDQYCARCVHDSIDDDGEVVRSCAVWELHELYNHKECNNEDSMLHYLIPRAEGMLGNQECRMFWPDPIAVTRKPCAKT